MISGHGVWNEVLLVDRDRMDDAFLLFLLLHQDLTFDNPLWGLRFILFGTSPPSRVFGWLANPRLQAANR